MTSDTYDIDWMAFTIGLRKLENIFPRWTIVELCGYRPPVTDSSDYDDWICIVSKPFILSIPPRIPSSRDIKMAMIDDLYGNYHIIVRKSNHSATLITGRQYVALDILIAILIDIRMDSVRVVQYVMKCYWRTLAKRDQCYQFHFL